MKLVLNIRHWRAGIMAAVFLLACGGRAYGAALSQTPTDQKRQLVAEKSGSFPTRAGMTLHLILDRGDIVIHTQDAPRVDYHVRVEAPAESAIRPGLAGALAVSGRSTPVGVLLRAQSAVPQPWGVACSWVTFEVTIPKNYGVIVVTQGGNIQAGDLRGRINLATGGGNISVGNIDGSAHLVTAGGYITVRNVTEDLDAGTGGGHITVGNIAGSANLHTTGGHIRIASAARGARLQTGGGNISLGSSGMGLVAQTGGGQIEVGEVQGAVRAFTAGGGIHIVNSKGPTLLQSAFGSLYLTQVDDGLRAETRSGGITAWLNPNTHLIKPCVLESGHGDIVVYLPANLPLTIVATLQAGEEHQVFVDPALGMKVTTATSPGLTHEVRAEGVMNGGGELLRLRTSQGNIRLLLNDPQQEAALSKQQTDVINKDLREQLKLMQDASGIRP